jgi:hypothetical protein
MTKTDDKPAFPRGPIADVDGRPFGHQVGLTARQYAAKIEELHEKMTPQMRKLLAWMEVPELADLPRQLLAVMQERDKALAIADEVADEFMARGQVEEAFGANEVAERLRAAQQGEVTGSVAAPQE